MIYFEVSEASLWIFPIFAIKAIDMSVIYYSLWICVSKSASNLMHSCASLLSMFLFRCSELEFVLDRLSSESKKSVESAVVALKSAAEAISEHTKKLKQAMEVRLEFV